MALSLTNLCFIHSKGHNDRGLLQWPDLWRWQIPKIFLDRTPKNRAADGITAFDFELFATLTQMPISVGLDAKVMRTNCPRPGNSRLDLASNPSGQELQEGNFLLLTCPKHQNEKENAVSWSYRSIQFMPRCTMHFGAFHMPYVILGLAHAFRSMLASHYHACLRLVAASLDSFSQFLFSRS